jgi:hypothetical protein
MFMPLNSNDEVLEEEWVDPVASLVSDAKNSGSEVSNLPASLRGSDGVTSD